MDWGTSAATVSGGSSAVAGTVPADHFRHRREESRGTGDRRRAVRPPCIGAGRRHRVTARAESDGKALTPRAFGRANWDGTDRCPRCRTAAASPASGD